MNTYICIDLETTGLDPKVDRIIEIGAVKIVDGKQEQSFSTYVNPGRTLEERIVELTGIKDEDLKNAPTIKEVLPDLLHFLGDLPWLGHSILFDYSFLKRAAVDNNYTLEKKAIDTLRISRKYLQELESRSLDYLCKYYEIPHHAHRALADAQATVELYNILVERFYSEEDPFFEPAPLLYKAKKSQPATKAQLERLHKLVEYHKIDLNIQIETLTKSEASRLTDKIYSQYGRI